MATSIRALHVAADAAYLAYGEAVGRAYEQGIKLDAMRAHTATEEAADTDAAIARLDGARSLADAFQTYVDSPTTLHYDEAMAAALACHLSDQEATDA